MFDEKHYVPVLKGKQGELQALEALTDSVRMHLTPLMEVAPIPWDWEEERPQRTLDDHLTSFLRGIRRAWRTDRGFFIDFLNLSEHDRVADGRSPLTFALDVCRE